MTNLLLPFTHGIDAPAITSALVLAQRMRSTLVAISLIRLPAEPGKRHPRLEDIQQSRDFLVYVQRRAAKKGVRIERVELYTRQSASSIRSLARELECIGILVFVRRGAGVLLATGEVKQLLEERSLPLYICLLPSSETGLLHPGWLSRWFGR